MAKSTVNPQPASLSVKASGPPLLHIGYLGPSLSAEEVSGVRRKGEGFAGVEEVSGVGVPGVRG
jgi:hypothetical protein